MISPPFRAEHIGSFLRPAKLLEARKEQEAGRIDLAALRAIEDEAIRDAVKLQEELGFKCVTDGELRRESYSENFTVSGLSGIEAGWAASGKWAHADDEGNPRAGRVTTVRGPIKWNASQNAENLKFLQSLTKALPKMTLPGPAYVHFRAGRKNISHDVYPNIDDFWNDIVAAYRKELAVLAEAGCRYLQFDETSFAKFGDPKIRAALAERGENWQDVFHKYIEVTNAVVSGPPAGMRIGMHLCRGNIAGHWQAEGGYDVVAETLFKRSNIDLFLLEYDSPRAGTFEPLKFLPDHKVVVLGVISTKVAELEPEDLIISRVQEAAKYVSMDRLALSPQCGFASVHQGNKISPEQQKAKLRLVVDLAQRLWREN